MLRYRVISSVLMSVALVAVVVCELAFAGQNQQLDQGLFTAAVLAVLMAFAAAEYCKLVRLGGHKPFDRIVVVSTTILLMLPAMPFAGKASAQSAALGSAVMLMFLTQMATGQTEGALRRMGVSLLGIFYLGLLGSFAVRIRVEHNTLVLAAVLLVTKFCDIGAYVLGRRFGRTKMVPWISPGKTWEGLLGGIVLATLFSVLAVPAFFWLLGWPPGCEVWTFGIALVLGPLLSVIGQVGDLAESMIKRDVQQKDSSGAVPGFGGLLDVIDSPLFAVPTAWAVLSLWPR